MKASTSKIRTILVDDESLARRGLTLRLQQYPEIELLAQCSNGAEALAKVSELQPDLLFLDIQMPGLNGFDVVAGLQPEQMPAIVFVTAFDQYALQAFDVHALDYVLKPVDESRLATTIDRVVKHFDNREAQVEKERLLAFIQDVSGESKAGIPAQEFADKIAIKDKGEITLVETQYIDWVDAAGDYMCIHERGKTHVMRATMKQLESQLNPEVFPRVHRSTIVNINTVEKIISHSNSEYFLQLKCGERLKMSRSYKDKISRFM